MEYFVETPKQGYFLNEDSIAKVETMYGAQYLGYWAIKTKFGSWAEEPVDVFYQPNPDVSKGHTNYFGIFSRGGSVYICNAESAFEEEMVGVACPSGEVLVSRYRHDCVMKEGLMIDGGRDYIRRSGAGKDVLIGIDGGNFVIREYTHE